MKILLDTHAFIWFIMDDAKLSRAAKNMIESTPVVMISVATAWEMAIKMKLGKLNISATFDQIFPYYLTINHITVLPIELRHLSLVASLPLHHRDPFDRLMIAQSIVDHLPIVSRDSAFDAYGITRLW